MNENSVEQRDPAQPTRIETGSRPLPIPFEQRKILVDYICNNTHSYMVTDRGSVRINESTWADVAKLLNVVPNGVQRTPIRWRRYWYDLWLQTKKRAYSNVIKSRKPWSYERKILRLSGHSDLLRYWIQTYEKSRSNPIGKRRRPYELHQWRRMEEKDKNAKLVSQTIDTVYIKEEADDPGHFQFEKENQAMESNEDRNFVDENITNFDIFEDSMNMDNAYEAKPKNKSEFSFVDANLQSTTDTTHSGLSSAQLSSAAHALAAAASTFANALKNFAIALDSSSVN